jgi:hypothetical protein
LPILRQYIRCQSITERFESRLLPRNNFQSLRVCIVSEHGHRTTSRCFRIAISRVGVVVVVAVDLAVVVLLLRLTRSAFQIVSWKRQHWQTFLIIVTAAHRSLGGDSGHAIKSNPAKLSRLQK